MSDDFYNGWANRESWALHLWLTNDEWLYHTALRIVCQDLSITAVADQLKNWIDLVWWSLAETHDGRNIIRDLGSTWRIDYEAVAKALREE